MRVAKRLIDNARALISGHLHWQICTCCLDGVNGPNWTSFYEVSLSDPHLSSHHPAKKLPANPTTTMTRPTVEVLTLSQSGRSCDKNVAME